MEADPRLAETALALQGSSAPSSLGKDSWALKRAARALTLAVGRPPRGSQQPAQVASVGLSDQQWGDDCRGQRPEEAIRSPVQDLQQMTEKQALDVRLTDSLSGPEPRRAAQRNPAGPSELPQQQIWGPEGRRDSRKGGTGHGTFTCSASPPRCPSVEDQSTGGNSLHLIRSPKSSAFSGAGL